VGSGRALWGKRQAGSSEGASRWEFGIVSHELVRVSVFYGVPWHQFGRMRRRQFSFTQTDTGPERDAV